MFFVSAVRQLGNVFFQYDYLYVIIYFQSGDDTIGVFISRSNQARYFFRMSVFTLYIIRVYYVTYIYT